MGKGNHARRVEECDLPEAVAFWAGAHRVVEGKQAWLQLGQRIAAYRAGELGRKQMFLARVHFHRQRAAVGVAQRGLETFGQALLGICAHLETIDHHFDGVLLVLVELGHGVDFVDFAIHPNPHETLRAQLGEEFEVFTLAPHHQRRQDHQLGVFRQRQHRVDHLRHRLRGQRNAVFRALRIADAGIQQAQVIVDFSDRADGRARVVAGGFLLDGNRRRQPLDQVDVGFLHQLQKLPGVGRQRFNVAALTLGIERVESE